MASPQWWDSPRGFPSPLLNFLPPHISHPRSQGSCPPTCLWTALGPMCHLVSTARGWVKQGVVMGKDPHALLLPGVGGHNGGGFGAAIWGLQQGCLGGVRGHSACRRVGPKSTPKVVVWQQGGPPTCSEDLASPAT